MSKIDRSKISQPTITISQMAWLQLSLIKENDFTLFNKHLRITISGKGCDGFSYSVGFTEIMPDDFKIELKKEQVTLNILMDPFAAFYLQECFIDYLQDLENENEGFLIKNNEGEKYHGKFWREDQNKVPPMIQDKA